MLSHIALAGALKAPRLVIDNEEADKLSAALDAVLSHYINVDVDPVTRDWINLAMVAGGVYGPRVFAAMAEGKKEKRVETPAPAELKPSIPGMQKVVIPGVGEVDMPMQ